MNDKKGIPGWLKTILIGIIVIVVVRVGTYLAHKVRSEDPNYIYSNIQKELDKIKFPISTNADNGILWVDAKIDIKTGTLYYYYILNYGENNKILSENLKNNIGTVIEGTCKDRDLRKTIDKINNLSLNFSGEDVEPFSISVNKETCKKY